MKKILFGLVLAASLTLGTMAQERAESPWLECAERYLPEVEESSRHDYRVSLVHAYARAGDFARAQAMIDAAGPQAAELGAKATLGAVRGDHIDQALKWAALYIPAQEVDWSAQGPVSFGSDREALLRAARSPESAARLLDFLRRHGGVSPRSLAFVNRELGGLPVAVSDLYFREFARLAEQARPFDWVQLEESLEASGEEFRALNDRVLQVVLTHQADLVQELARPGGEFRKEQMEEAMIRYAATLLARHGRFKEADEMWSRADAPEAAELRAYLQNQYLGGRREALADLARQAGLEEDAKVQLSQFLMALGHFEEVKALGTDPVEYLDYRIALRDLGRGQKVDHWLAFVARLDQTAAPSDSRLFALAVDRDMPAEVRRKAAALLPDEAAKKASQAYLAEAITELQETDVDRMTMMLLLLDEDIDDSGCLPSTESLKALEALCAKRG